VFFSDHNIRTTSGGSSYNTLNKDAVSPIGASTRLIGDAPSTNLTWQYFGNTSPVTVLYGGSTQSWNVSYIEFKPDGTTGNIQSAAGLKLMAGAVLNPSPLTVLVSDTNNWRYIEYDQFGGRVRTRTPESFN
jgi:hypothetical protein